MGLLQFEIYNDAPCIRRSQVWRCLPKWQNVEESDIVEIVIRVNECNSGHITCGMANAGLKRVDFLSFEGLCNSKEPV